MGFQPNRYNAETVSLSGPATVTGPSRYPNFRIFDASRVVAKFTAPATGPATVARNPVGNVQIECARMHEKIPLNYEELSNLSPVVGPNSVIDPGGQNYVSRQTRFIARQFNMAVEMMTAGMLRDSLYLIQSASPTGQAWYPSFSAPASNTTPSLQINFQVPAGNKSQLNMLGTGNIIDLTWANAGAHILSHLMQIEAAFTQLTGYSMTDVWINSVLWYSILVNTEIRNVGGSANTVFAEFEREPEKGMDGEPSTGYFCVLRAIPTVRWHICNDVVALNTDIDPSYGTAPATATLSKLVPDNTAIFCTEPSATWAQMYQGGEYVVEQPGMPGMLRQGYYFWKEFVTQPSGVDLIGLANLVPLLYIPKIVAPANVTGF
jgi:hypothetical protein